MKKGIITLLVISVTFIYGQETELNTYFYHLDEFSFDKKGKQIAFSPTEDINPQLFELEYLKKSGVQLSKTDTIRVDLALNRKVIDTLNFIRKLNHCNLINNDFLEQHEFQKLFGFLYLKKHNRNLVVQEKNISCLNVNLIVEGLIWNKSIRKILLNKDSKNLNLMIYSDKKSGYIIAYLLVKNRWNFTKTYHFRL